MDLRTVASKVVSATPLANFPVRVRGGLAKGARWTMFPFSQNWRSGGHEIDVHQALHHLSSTIGAVFWDFGAHFGIHTVGLARQVGPTGQVAAFEPDKVAFDKLTRHCAMNDLRNVKLYNSAVSANTGTGRLYFPLPAGSSCSHFAFYADHTYPGVPSSIVKTVSADDLVASGEIRLPSLIKIDVQGHGGEAVAGAIKSITKSMPVIAFSNHSDREIAETQSLLMPLGYSVIGLDGNNLSQVPTVGECLFVRDR